MREKGTLGHRASTIARRLVLSSEHATSPAISRKKQLRLTNWRQFFARHEERPQRERGKINRSSLIEVAPFATEIIRRPRGNGGLAQSRGAATDCRANQEWKKALATRSAKIPKRSDSWFRNLGPSAEFSRIPLRNLEHGGTDIPVCADLAILGKLSTGHGLRRPCRGIVRIPRRSLAAETNAACQRTKRNAFVFISAHNRSS